MPISADAITHKRLILIKQLYQQALIQAGDHSSSIRRIMAVIGFDLAIETMLKAVVSALDTKKVADREFQAIIQQADDLLAKNSLLEVPDKAHIRHVHEIRNGVQHKATYPNDTDISDCRTYTRDFLQKVTQEVWGLSFEKISLSELVKHPKVREDLLAGEAALSEGNYVEAVRQASIGLERAFLLLERKLVGRGLKFIRGIMVERGFDDIVSSPDVLKTLEKMQETMLHLLMGSNEADHAHYKQIAGPMVWYIGQGGPYPKHFRIKQDVDDHEAEFVLNYCIESVIEIENRVVDIDNPYLREPLA
jgi:hypothetical protein